MKKLNKQQKIATYDFFVGQAMLVILPRFLEDSFAMLLKNSVKTGKKKDLEKDFEEFNHMKFSAIDSCFELADHLMIMRSIKRSEQKGRKLAEKTK